MNTSGKKLSSTLTRFPDELKIKNGKGTVTFLGMGVVEYHCDGCGAIWWMSENMAGSCPVCCKGNPESTWTQPRIAFIPQK
jgi:rubrerythrin